MKKYPAVFLLTLLIALPCFPAAGIFRFYYDEGDKYNLQIRENYKIYINNRYVGLKSREMKGIMSVFPGLTEDQQDRHYSVTGKVFNISKTIRGHNIIGYRLDNVADSAFSFDQLGNTVHRGGLNFPPVQGIPIFPESSLAEQQIFSGTGTYIVDFYDSAAIEEIPVHYNTQYFGKRDFFGTDYDYFEITYVLDSNYTSDQLSKINGKHNVRYFFDGAAGKPVFMEDKFEDYFLNRKGEIMKRKGFTLYFFKPIQRMNKQEVVKDIQSRIDEESILIKEDIEFQKEEEGIRLTINNLKFQPNSTVLLSGEEEKLEKLAAVLGQIENRSFLITGHTADVGDPGVQLTLSLERAAVIAEYLEGAGIEGKRIMYTGKGGTQPAVPNTSPENMQKNRRVEIMILED